MAQGNWPEQVEEALALQAILGPDFEALGAGEVTAEAGKALLARGPPPGGVRWRILVRPELPPEGLLLQVCKQSWTFLLSAEMAEVAHAGGACWRYLARVELLPDGLALHVACAAHLYPLRHMVRFKSTIQPACTAGRWESVAAMGPGVPCA